MPAALPIAFLLALLSSSSRGCIPTETPDYIYDQEWLQEQEMLKSTTSVLLSTVRETTPTAPTSPSSAAPTTTTTATTSSSTSTSTSTSASTTTTTTTSLSCPAGWVSRPSTGVCYFTSTTVENWQAAETICGNVPGVGHLASIEDQAENDFILNNLIPPGYIGNLWIGLKEPMNQQTLMGMTTWTDGTPYNYPGGYTNWIASGPPLMSTDDRCVLMGHTGAEDGKWTYTVCGNTNIYICEMRPA